MVGDWLKVDFAVCSLGIAIGVLVHEVVCLRVESSESALAQDRKRCDQCMRFLDVLGCYSNIEHTCRRSIKVLWAVSFLIHTRFDTFRTTSHI